jgi:Alginate export
MRTIVLLITSYALCAASLAQAPPPGAASSNVHFSGSWRVRMEAWDWFDTSLADSSYAFPASLLRVGISNSGERFRWQLEAAVPVLLGLPEHAIAPAPQGQLGLGAAYFASNGANAVSVFPKQAWVSFHSSGPHRNSLRLGRFEFIEGTETTPSQPALALLKRERIAHRLIGTFGFTHVGRSLDGVQFAHDSPNWNLTLMAARATRGVFTVDAVGELDVDLQYGALTRKIGDSAEWRLFGIAYHDGRPVLKSDNRPLPARAADTRNLRIGTVGANGIAARKVGPGTADGLLWTAWQFGRWGELTHRAGAVALEGGYQWNAPWHPWLRAGYFRGSGDSNPNDQTHGTFFQLLPTPRVYARFPFFNLMNNEDVFLQVFLAPHSKLKVRSEAHVLRLSSARDLWYLGGGAFDSASFGYLGRPSSGRRGLANLYDIGVDYQLRSPVTLSAYAGFVQGKSTIAVIYPQGRTAKFGYIEFLYKF